MCPMAKTVSVYALQVLSSDEAAVVAAHLAGCSECQRELEALRPVIDSFRGWPGDTLRPSNAPWNRLLERVASATRGR
jgi:anti-sigma factor RsiW